MATFSSKTFNSALYQSFRPGYNANFFKMVYDYHSRNHGQFDVAVDVGTGTGQVASVLAEKFKQAYGVDASETMLASAVQKPNLTYYANKGEDLKDISSGSVDVLTIAEAIHWLDRPKFFSEVKRVLKPHGTFVALGYGFPVFEKYPRASQLIFELGNEPDKLGPIWELGRLIADNLYKCIEVPLDDVERHYFPNNKDGYPLLMSEQVSMEHFRNYLKTWSGYKTFSERHPERPDIVDETIEAILKEEGLKNEDVVDVTWPTVLILARNNA
ncbi:S-adenosyl-L-methionine-dependent methyltransferase [Lobosporangium transversale]|uniref:S-adenosyl-L-methionine-dependent methyltransferase n=1 Tax=Lobosporangium transversale TaxID=64571 RepID=A0A1Y2GYU2_9FUNG|nr:S-adenosyl-L-methionine-dependent methyltransferase [Lobosporangium transversale]ORZ24766.1 S-adenosyl-L-methionine-dependent methyltransferase [Lobosporangium transversale]|eukprot:XP_021883747.1 S-adenosyl-L-methionine-dependent methyltransferase [Lobosporangium transversale]